MLNAVKDAMKQADEGDAAAMCSLGDWHLKGVNELPKDEDAAYSWYKKAAEMNHREGKRKAKRIEMKKEVDAMKAMAENGDAEAMYDLGIWHENGHNGLRKNDVKAYYWYKKASDAGGASGMAAVGSWQLNGFGGIKRNVANGLLLLISAARLGSNIACNTLGIIYYEGLDDVGVDIDKNMKEAKYWLEKALKEDEEGCEERDLPESCKDKARQYLREIEESEG